MSIPIINSNDIPEVFTPSSGFPPKPEGTGYKTLTRLGQDWNKLGKLVPAGSIEGLEGNTPDNSKFLGIKS